MKSRPSKLDQYAAQIADLDAEKKTLPEIAQWLLSEGCRVAPSTLSVYLERLRSERRRALQLAQIASGARQVDEVEKQFAKNPAPELETLIKLLRVQILQLATKSMEQPEFLDLTNTLTKTVMDFASGQTKAALEKTKLAQGERKLQLLEKKAAAFDQAKGVLQNKELTEAQRAARMREVFGIS